MQEQGRVRVERAKERALHSPVPLGNVEVAVEDRGDADIPQLFYEGSGEESRVGPLGFGRDEAEDGGERFGGEDDGDGYRRVDCAARIRSVGTFKA